MEDAMRFRGQGSLFSPVSFESERTFLCLRDNTAVKDQNLPEEPLSRTNEKGSTSPRVERNSADESPAIMQGEQVGATPDEEGRGVEEVWSARERLKRHRVDVAGRVRIPDMWGQEDRLKKWIDSSSFDAGLVTKKILSARSALVREGRTSRASGLRI